MTTTSTADHVQWYRANRPLYERLGQAVHTIVSELLRTRALEYLNVTFRTKTVESFAGKLERKTYSDPRSEVTDFCGLRIVTYLQSDVDRVVAMLREAFAIDEPNSVDKSTLLEVDRVGYRSVHLVCTLGPSRERLLEYAGFAGLRFEIQVRTALQHSWAQVEHDRNYKFGGVLPAILRRRLHLAAGSLELIDLEFDRIAQEVEAYATEVHEAVERGDVVADLNTTSLRSLLAHRASRLQGFTFTPLTDSEAQALVIRELTDFGVTSIQEIDTLLSDEFFSARAKYPEAAGYLNEIGWMRDAMMYADLDKYFDQAHRGEWGAMEESTANMLAEKYGHGHVGAVLNRADVFVVPDDDMWRRGNTGK